MSTYSIQPWMEHQFNYFSYPKWNKEESVKRFQSCGWIWNCCNQILLVLCFTLMAAVGWSGVFQILSACAWPRCWVNLRVTTWFHIFLWITLTLRKQENGLASHFGYKMNVMLPTGCLKMRTTSLAQNSLGCSLFHYLTTLYLLQLLDKQRIVCLFDLYLT